MFTYTHKTTMPFGPHFQKRMENVPASYLLALKDCNHAGVRQYIADNLTEIQNRAKNERYERR